MICAESENNVLVKLYAELHKLENEKVEHTQAMEKSDLNPEVIKAHCNAIKKIDKTIEALNVRIQKNELREMERIEKEKEKAEKSQEKELKEKEKASQLLEKTLRHMEKEAERLEKERQKEKIRLEKEELKKKRQMEKEEAQKERAEKRRKAEVICQVNFNFPTEPFNCFQFYQMMKDADELTGKKFDDAVQQICIHWNTYYYKILNKNQYRMFNARTDDFDVVFGYDLRQTFDAMKSISERIYDSIIENQPQYEFIYEKNTSRFNKYSDSHGLINLCPLYKVVKLYEKDFNPEGWNQSKNLKIWNEYLHNEFCDKKEVQIEFVEQWMARVQRGMKNESCIVCRGKQGIGKSTFAKMMKRMLHKDFYIESMNSDALKSQFNAELENKVFVCLEEMHSTNVADWTKQSSNLKDWCTGESILMEGKGRDRISIPN